jgi:heme-degrading monooxygenase HmoA
MLKRIVKMTFRPEAVPTFIHEVFENSKDRIRSFPGCQHMELLRSTMQPNILFTLSIWDGPEALEQYRQSDFFQDTWMKTKALFAEKAEAWSADVVDAPLSNGKEA